METKNFTPEIDNINDEPQVEKTGKGKKVAAKAAQFGAAAAAGVAATVGVNAAINSNPGDVESLEDIIPTPEPHVVHHQPTPNPEPVKPDEEPVDVNPGEVRIDVDPIGPGHEPGQIAQNDPHSDYPGSEPQSADVIEPAVEPVMIAEVSPEDIDLDIDLDGMPDYIPQDDYIVDPNMDVAYNDDILDDPTSDFMDDVIA